MDTKELDELYRNKRKYIHPLAARSWALLYAPLGTDWHTAPKLYIVYFANGRTMFRDLWTHLSYRVNRRLDLTTAALVLLTGYAGIRPVVDCDRQVAPGQYSRLGESSMEEGLKAWCERIDRGFVDVHNRMLFSVSSVRDPDSYPCEVAFRPRYSLCMFEGTYNSDDRKYGEYTASDVMDQTNTHLAYIRELERHHREKFGGKA